VRQGYGGQARVRQGYGGQARVRQGSGGQARVRRGFGAQAIACVLMTLLPALCAAQSDPSRLWIVAGGASTTVRGDCQTCEEDYPYRHGGSILADIGYRATPRMDVGAEIFWAPIDTNAGQIRATHFDAVAQFRPWQSHGFFLKGGAGMGFVRNWVDTLGTDAINSKALSVVIGGGWAFRTEQRVSFQLFASQHALALGDLQTEHGEVADVMGNYWSIGAAIVIR
jgi:hypothetical protein